MRGMELGNNSSVVFKSFLGLFLFLVLFMLKFDFQLSCWIPFI
jgi:hypothetical protein